MQPASIYQPCYRVLDLFLKQQYSQILKNNFFLPTRGLLIQGLMQMMLSLSHLSVLSFLGIAHMMPVLCPCQQELQPASLTEMRPALQTRARLGTHQQEYFPELFPREAQWFSRANSQEQTDSTTQQEFKRLQQTIY